MMDVKTINRLTSDWTENDYYDFLHFYFNDGADARAYSAERLFTKLIGLGFAERNKDRVRLTEAGEAFRAELAGLEDSPRLTDANLKLRYHRLKARHDTPLATETLLRLAEGRSANIRELAAGTLMDDDEADEKAANRLAANPDPKVRRAAARHADPHLFLNETDYTVIDAVIKAGRADDTCRERWTAPDEPFDIRLMAGELVTDGKEADRILATMTLSERELFLGRYPRLAVGRRAVDVCRENTRESSLIEYQMTRVPDDYLREALNAKGHWGIKSRVDDYRKALRKVLEMERLFTGPDSQVLAEIKAGVRAEETEEDE